MVALDFFCCRWAPLAALCNDPTFDLIRAKLSPTDARGLVLLSVIPTSIVDGGGDLVVVVGGIAVPLELPVATV